MDKGHFDLHIQIIELQLKLQLTTPLDIRDKCKASIRTHRENLDVAVKDFSELFKETLELWASLQEDPQVTKIKVSIQDKQLKYDEIKETWRTLVPVQQFSSLKEGTSLQA